jgi:hypothetical protein
LTDFNANVYYELAIRHVFRGPLVEIIKKGQRIPFDISATRVIQMDDPDLDNVEALKKEVAQHIKAAERGEADNPITVAIDIRALEKSGKPVESQLASVITMLAEIRSQLTAMQQNLQPASSPVQDRRLTPQTGRLAFNERQASSYYGRGVVVEPLLPPHTAQNLRSAEDDPGRRASEPDR